MKKFNLKMVDGYSAKEGVMKITKGAMVIMKGKKIGNFIQVAREHNYRWSCSVHFGNE
jgi:hypothetical protein